MEAPGKTQHKVVLLFWLLKLPWCICFSFAVIYLALLLSAVYTPPPPPLRHQLPSPFPHGEHLLWEMYSLEDNKGLIGKTSLWAVCWKQAKRQRERMWWHYTPDVFTQVVFFLLFSFFSLRSSFYPSPLKSTCTENTDIHAPVPVWCWRKSGLFTTQPAMQIKNH